MKLKFFCDNAMGQGVRTPDGIVKPYSAVLTTQPGNEGFFEGGGAKLEIAGMEAQQFENGCEYEIEVHLNKIVKLFTAGGSKATPKTGKP